MNSMSPDLKPLPWWCMWGTDAMVDIETLSTAPNAVIISIGAVKFNPQVLNTIEQLDEFTFYQNIDREDSQRYNLHVDADTIRWWSQQSQEAQDATKTNLTPLRTACEALNKWLTDYPRANRIWAKDPDFDVVILRENFKMVGLKMFPIPFWLTRSVRTITDLTYPNGHDAPNIRVGTHHNALDDCISQALMVQHCHGKLGLIPNDDRVLL